MTEPNKGPAGPSAEKAREDLIERAVKKARQERPVRSMNPDRDFSWENTDFGDHEND
jgi:hypothetical protein